MGTDELKLKAIELGFTTCGICSATSPQSLGHLNAWIEAGFGADMSYLASGLRQDPATILPGVQSIIAVSLNYYQAPDRQPGEPKIARYALGRDYHKVLRGKLKALERVLQADYPEAKFRACVDSAPILEREYAHRAGLGWFGKNTCLIDSKRGSWFFIGLLLTTAELTPDRPSLGGCGTCTRCIDACPTGAIVQLEGKWSVDARKCISYLTIEKRGPFSEEEAAAIGDWTFGCDVCQEVCPFNSESPHAPDRGKETAEADFLRQSQWPSLLQMAKLSDEDFDALTKGTALRRARGEGIRRNAQANLFNLDSISNG
jgi:epoxyqueuosine reductase